MIILKKVRKYVILAIGFIGLGIVFNFLGNFLPPISLTDTLSYVYFYGIVAIRIILPGLAGLFALLALVAWRKSKKQQEKEIKTYIDRYELKNEIQLFISYSHSDSSTFQIPKIAEYLRNQENIKEVLYSEKDTWNDFVKYMNTYLEQCDGMLLFCTEASYESEFVIDEWAAARALKKPIIPIYTKVNFIPPLFKAKIGVKFTPLNFSESVEAIYGVIKRRLGEPIEQ